MILIFFFFGGGEEWKSITTRITDGKIDSNYNFTNVTRYSLL